VDRLEYLLTYNQLAIIELACEAIPAKHSQPWLIMEERTVTR
jgi:hypothetical protein